MVRLPTMTLTLAMILAAACATVEPTGKPSARSTVDSQPCESKTTWDRECMMTPPDPDPERRWPDPVPEFSAEMLCTGECMVPWWESNSVYDEAEAIEPFADSPWYLLPFDWLRDLLAPSEPE